MSIVGVGLVETVNEWFRTHCPAGQWVFCVQGSGCAVCHQDPLSEIVEIAVSKGDSLQHFDLVVASFREPVRISAVKTVQDVFRPVPKN